MHTVFQKSIPWDEQQTVWAKRYNHEVRMKAMASLYRCQSEPSSILLSTQWDANLKEKRKAYAKKKILLEKINLKKNRWHEVNMPLTWQRSAAFGPFGLIHGSVEPVIGDAQKLKLRSTFFRSQSVQHEPNPPLRYFYHQNGCFRGLTEVSFQLEKKTKLALHYGVSNDFSQFSLLHLGASFYGPRKTWERTE